MSRNRTILDSIESQMASPKAPKGTCRWCGTSPLPAHRTRWCSDECSSRFETLWNPNFYRPLVFNRAHGRCEGCGWDVKKHVSQVAKWLATLQPIYNGIVAPREIRLPGTWHLLEFIHLPPPVDLTWRFRREAYERVKAVVRKVGGDVTKGRSYGLWEVDHVIPLSEGGIHSLENLRLLCRTCHKAETKQLAARRAAARRKR